VSGRVAGAGIEEIITLGRILALLAVVALVAASLVPASVAMAQGPGAIPPTLPDGPIVLPNGKVLPVEPGWARQSSSVAAEMLSEHQHDRIDFQPGAHPNGRGTATVALAPAVGQSATLLGLAAPGGATTATLASLPNGLRKEVLGFLPYWMLDASTLQWMQYQLVSTIAYFGIAARSDGSLATGTTSWNGWYSSAMTNVTNAAHARGVRVVVTITMMAYDGGAGQATLLSSATYRQNLVANIVKVVSDRNADGVNLDFEPVYAAQRDQYTSFVKQLKAGLVAAGVGSYLTVDTSAGAATWSTGYDVAGLTAAGAADALFVMGYDYSWSGSARAGGVAPMSSPYILDVNDSVNDYLSLTSGSKLIWGVPYYGRTWLTQSNALNAPTQPSSSSSSAAYYYTGMTSLAAKYGRKWDPVGQVPWFAYYDGSKSSWVEGYYDDAQSLGVKWDMVNQRGLAGSGMWTLLMDAGDNTLWNLLAKKFVNDTSPPTGGITNMPAQTDAYAVPVSWHAVDVGSGVSTYTVQVRDRASTTWSTWLAGTTLTSGTYLGQLGHTYEFRVSAVDRKGNAQLWVPPMVAPGSSLTAGGFASASVDGLNVRSGAGTTYAVIDQLSTGDLVEVMAGPLTASGYDWYQVQFGFTEWPSSDYPRVGWVAAASGGSPYLVPAVAPTVTTLVPTIAGYGLSRRLISPKLGGALGTTTVSYTLPAASTGTTLDVLNAAGQIVSSEAVGGEAAGAHAITWGGRVASGAYAPDGQYLLRLTVVDATGTHFAPVTSPDAGALAAWGVTVDLSASTYHPLAAPTRIVDSRIGLGLPTRLSMGVPQSFQVTGVAGVPAGATGVTGNLTVTNQTGLGYVALTTTSQALPATSTLNFPVGDNRANGVTVPLSGDGKLWVVYRSKPGTTVDVVFDLTGYFTS
jgi:spore germination protein YaaH